MLIDFCIPVKNEEKILKANIFRLFNFLKKQKNNYLWNIVIIINGSNDNSLKIAQKIKSEIGDYIKFKHIKDGGKGLALKEYFKESTADILVFMDTDLSTSLDNINPLIKTILDEDYDISIGSRSLPESNTVRPLSRKIISNLYNNMSRLILKHNFNDLQCGFKAFKSEVFKKVLPYLEDDSWFFDTEFLILSQRKSYKIKEIRVDWQENRYFKRKTRLSLFSDSLYFFNKTLAFKKRINKSDL